MTTKIRIILWTLAILAPVGMVVRAAAPASAPPTGRVLILENERILEGDIDKVGEQYRIRRLVGETWVPSDQVLCLCRDMEGAYGYLKTRANLRDPDERLRLARWCQLHNLRSQALEEAKAAVDLRPDRQDALHMVRSLKQSLPAPNLPPSSQALDKGEVESNPASSLELNTEAVGQFTVRVQPILMNTCANCHASGRGGAFKLIRVFQDNRTSRKATQQNLAAVMVQVNRERPLASPLLTRAVSVHGDADPPPLKGRQTAAYRILEEWVRLAVTEAQPDESSSPVATLPTPEVRPFVEAGTKAKAAPPSTPAASPAAVDPASQFASPKPPTPPTAPVDPFDPVTFNRQMHPSPASGN